MCSARCTKNDRLTRNTGGYDKRVQENVSYHTELTSLATSLNLTYTTATSEEEALATPADIEVLFILSVPSPLKTRLLQSSSLLLYTPSHEHFGIVPLEAMLARTPVLAANNGGPTETVVENETGWLRSPADVASWTQVMQTVLSTMKDAQLAAMGEKGRKRVVDNFSKSKMAQRLVFAMEQAHAVKEEKRPGVALFAGVLVWNVLGLALGGMVALLMVKR